MSAQASRSTIGGGLGTTTLSSVRCCSGADRYTINFELYNVLTRQRLLGYQISANRPGLRLASHQIADMVFDKILGIRGAFATRIAYVSVLGSVPHRNYRLIVADSDGENPHIVMQSNDR